MTDRNEEQADRALEAFIVAAFRHDPARPASDSLRDLPPLSEKECELAAGLGADFADRIIRGEIGGAGVADKRDKPISPPVPAGPLAHAFNRAQDDEEAERAVEARRADARERLRRMLEGSKEQQGPESDDARDD